MTLRRAIPRLFILAMVAMIAAVLADRAGLIDLPRRYDPLAVPDLDETPNLLTSTQLKTIDFDAGNCRFALARAKLNPVLLPAQGVGTACERSSTIELTRLSQAKLKPEQTRCNVAARLYMWEKHIVQPAARHYFGEEVAEIMHFGSYNCRTIAGSWMMSEHATANAFDISGFRLHSGKIISILKDWNGASSGSRFLHKVRDGACDYFNITLSPDYNAAHRDHFHVDMGWLRRCG